MDEKEKIEEITEFPEQSTFNEEDLSVYADEKETEAE